MALRPEIRSGGALLEILIWSEMSVFFGALVLTLLVARNLQRYLMVPTAAGAISNVLLNLYLIPRYSATGAAIATVASYSIGWMVILLFFPETRPTIYDGWKTALPALLIAAASVWVASLLPFGDLLRVVAGLSAFIVGTLLTGLIHREDVAFAWSAVAGMFARARLTIRAACQIAEILQLGATP